MRRRIVALIICVIGVVLLGVGAICLFVGRENPDKNQGGKPQGEHQTDTPEWTVNGKTYLSEYPMHCDISEYKYLSTAGGELYRDQFGNEKVSAYGVRLKYLGAEKYTTEYCLVMPSEYEEETVTTIFGIDGDKWVAEYVFCDGIATATATNCPRLKRIVLGDAVDDLLVASCPALVEIQWPEAGVLEYVVGLWQCDSLESVILPDSVKYVDTFCYNMPSLTELKLPDGLEYIGNSSIGGLDSLEYVDIPDTVTYIGEEVFTFCPKLTVGVGKGTVAEQYCIDHGIPYVYH